jgi:amidase
MTRSVRDAAMLLTAIAGTDPADPATANAHIHRIDYAAPLQAATLKGLRIGVLRDRIGSDPEIAKLFDAALATMKREGAEIVEIKESRKGLEKLAEAEFTVLLHELKADMAAYLKTLPRTVKPRSLADLIAFNKANAAAEMHWFGQDIFEAAQTKGELDDPAYASALATSKKLAGPEGIDRLLREHKVDLLAGVTNGPAWVTDLVNGDRFVPPSFSQLPAVAGYPHLTVPMGAIKALPVGLSLVGLKWSDAKVLAAGHAYEQASNKRVKPGFLPSLEAPK